MTSQAMVIAASAKAAIDFSSLVEGEQARLLRIAARLLRDEDAARDLVQATFADAYERRRSLRDPGAAGAWLRRILVTRALNHLRRRRLWHRVRYLFGPSDTPEAITPEPAPDALVMRARRLTAVSRALDALSVQQAAAFTLRYLEGLDLDEVAQVMRIGRGTVRTHLHRALSAIRAALAGQEETS